MAFVKWTQQTLLKEAKKYKTKKDFRTNNSSAYAAAKYRGVLEKVCAHMIRARKCWTNKMLEDEAKIYNSRIDFKKGSNGAYQAASNRGILNQVCSHMDSLNPKWTIGKICKEALK